MAKTLSTRRTRLVIKGDSSGPSALTCEYEIENDGMREPKHLELETPSWSTTNMDTLWQSAISDVKTEESIP